MRRHVKIAMSGSLRLRGRPRSISVSSRKRALISCFIGLRFLRDSSGENRTDGASGSLPYAASRNEIMKPEELLRMAYAAFNARDIDAALALMHSDVAWPNAMEGGTMHGHGGVCTYWSPQWSMINPRVEPLNVTREAEGLYVVEVHQIVRDLEGALLADRIVHHAYRLASGKITSMEIRE